MAYLNALTARFLVGLGRLVDDAHWDAILDERECKGKARRARTGL